MPTARLTALAVPSLLAAAAFAGGVGVSDHRDVQFRAIDFDAGTVTMHNFGPADIDLTGWRFCSHDFDQQRRYTAAGSLNGVTIEAGTDFVVHFNNDAPVSPDAINASVLGNFAVPLDQDAFGFQIFMPNPDTGTVQFGNSTLIADHLQWNVNGSGVGTAEARTAQAVSTGLWTAIGAFIATQADTVRVELNDLSNGRLHGPDDYTVTNPAAGCNVADVAEPFGTLNIDDVLSFLDAFASGDAAADVAPPTGTLNIDDVLAFLDAFAAGCP